MSNITAIIIAATALAFTVPTTAVSAQGVKTQAKVVQKNGKTLYCVQSTITGSTLPHRTCLTKQEWEQRGAVIAKSKEDYQLAATPQVANQN